MMSHRIQSSIITKQHSTGAKWHLSKVYGQNQSKGNLNILTKSLQGKPLKIMWAHKIHCLIEFTDDIGDFQMKTTTMGLFPNEEMMWCQSQKSINVTWEKCVNVQKNISWSDKEGQDNEVYVK